MSEWLGDDGLVISALPHSPMQMLMIDWIGSEEGRFYFHHFDYPDLVEDLYRAVQKFFMPEYEKQAKVLHANGKLMAVHMDGRLDILKDLIAVTPIDSIEAFHPPPMGDLPASEALSLWRDRAVWVGFPGGPCTRWGPGRQRITP
ncbi:MAG TPA: hypothetical protein VMX75_07635 [Spirochaetia bacterium]|nr:hypothetical protein [Spirochaetia bacterium]